MEWKDIYENACRSAMQQHKSGKTGSAIETMQNCIDRVFDLIWHIQDADEQEAVASEVTSNITQTCEVIFENFKKDFLEFNSEYMDTIFNSDVETSRHNEKIFDEEVERKDYRVLDIAQVYASLGFKLIELFGDNCKIGKKGIAVIEKGIEIIDDNPFGTRALKREAKDTINSYKTRMAHIRAEVAKRRFKEYWDTHQSEKANFEAEKKSLNEQITDLNKEISVIPQNTDGYAHMVELQKKIQNLTSEKKALGFFKFKDKKAVQAQIDSVNTEIIPIQSRIDIAIEIVKKRISSLENKIKEIGTELTKPR